MAVFPVILVNSATGSDTTASVAGPAVDITGTAASVGATATSVSITDAVSLSGVAVLQQVPQLGDWWFPSNVTLPMKF